METNKAKIKQLLQRYKEGACTTEEIKALYEALSLDANAQLDEILVESLLEERYEVTDQQERLDRVFADIQTQITPSIPKRRLSRMLWPLATAAVLFLVFSISIYSYFSKPVVPDEPTFTQQDADVAPAPGTNKATLKLANGDVVSLQDDQSGIVMGGDITYTDGKSVRQQTGRGHDGPVDRTKLMYELSTPQGGTYQITLSDGTKVWLNAGSSLIYPAEFASDQRMVTLLGEGYFEVKKEQNRAFRVRSRDQIVEVLGTSFNVNAYPSNKNINTTLLDGKVKVGDGMQKAIVLKPGQQATYAAGSDIKVAEVNTAVFVGWKNGLFHFEETPLREALQQIGRWYDLDVQYQGTVTSSYFYGQMERNKPLKDVLEILEAGGIRFKLQMANGQRVLEVMSSKK